MTQTVSKRSSSAAVHYGFVLAKRNLKYGILALCMDLLGLPLVLIAALAEYASKLNNYESVIEYVDNIYLIIAEISAVIALIMGIYIAMGSFAHLYDKRLSDMEYALPLTANKRFLAGYFSGLAVYVLPYIVSQLISLLLIFIGMNTVDAQRTDGKTIYADCLSNCMTLFVGVLVIMVMFYTLFVLTMTFCGSKFETCVFGIAANLFIPTIFVCIIRLYEKYGYGTVFDVMDTFINRLFSCTSPIGALYGLYMLIVYPQTIIYLGDVPAEEQHSFFSLYSLEGWTVKCLVFTALLFVCGLLLYRRRKAEQTGETFISRPFYYVVMVCITAAVCLLMDYLETGIIPMIAATMAVFVIIDCIINRGIHKLIQSFVKYAAVMAGIAAVYFVSVMAMNVFVVNSVPEPSEIECVRLTAYCGYMNGKDNYFDSFRFYDEENIRTVTEAHKEQLRAYADNAEKSSDIIFNKWFGVKYTYKNGKEKERLYYDICSTVYEKLLALEDTDEMKEQEIAALINTLTACDDYILQTGSEKAGNNMQFESSENRDIFTDEFTEGLIQCLTEDIRSMTLEDQAGFDENSHYVMLYPGFPNDDHYFINDYAAKGSFYLGYMITGAYGRTLDYLDSHGIPVQGAEYSTDSILGYGCVEIGKAYGHDSLPVSKCESEILAVMYDPERYGNDSLEVKQTPYEELSEAELEELAQLLSEAIEWWYIPEGECYVISIDGGDNMYIPERFNDMVESMIS
ncbi:MAG: hypothetical protein ACI4XF_07615 [Oscillospiraceae bacterium]